LTRIKIVDDDQIIKLRAKGYSYKEIGERFGVPKQTIHKRIKYLQKQAAAYMQEPNPDALTRCQNLNRNQGRYDHTDKTISKHINAISQLEKINRYANKLLDALMAYYQGDEEALKNLEDKVKEIRVGEERLQVSKIKLKDPRDLALKAMSEIRNQLALQLEIFKVIYSVDAVREFQEVVIDAINSVSPELRDRIVQELHKRRAISGSAYRSWITR